MRFERKANFFLCIAFTISLLLPLLFTNHRPNTISIIENRKLNTFPYFYDANGEINQQIIKDFEDWFNDNIGFREEMFTINATIQYELFNTSSSPRVHMGKKGWLFYNSGNNLEIASGEYPNFDENALADICQKQQQIQKALSAQGIEYIIFLPPSKVSIYPEYLRGNFEIRKTPVDILADYLEANSSIKIIRLKQVLLEEKQTTDKLLYFKTDTHWNAYGAYVAYCEIIRQLNNWDIICSFPVEVDYIEGSTMRDLTRMILNNNEKYFEEAAYGCSIPNSTATLISEGEKYEEISNIAPSKSIVYYLNADQSSSTFLVFGDSMFMFMNIIPELLAQNCSEMVGIWQYEITQDLIDVTKPDVVFFEMTERALQSLGEQYNDLSVE